MAASAPEVAWKTGPGKPNVVWNKVVFASIASGGKAGGINASGGKALPTGGMAAWRQSVAAWRQSVAAWRHGGMAAKRGGMAAKLAASMPLAAKRGGMAAWRQRCLTGGKDNFAATKYSPVCKKKIKPCPGDV